MVNDRLATILEALQIATDYCEYIRTGKSRYRVVDKTDGSPVTIADVGSQLIIANAIKTAFPGEAIVGEEESAVLDPVDLGPFNEFVEGRGIRFGCSFEDLLERPDRANVRSFWTVDPVDGTAGFLRDDDSQYSICVAYIQEESPILSAISAPRLCGGLVMYAVSGKGTFVSGLNETNWRQVKVSPEGPGSTHIACSHHSRRDVIERAAGSVGMSLLGVDSQVKYMMVAMGSVAAYIRAPPNGYREKIWDHAPGYLLVKEAGGVVADQDGRDISFPADGLLCESVSMMVISGSQGLANRLLSMNKA